MQSTPLSRPASPLASPPSRSLCPLQLPSPTCGQSCPVRTPPLDEQDVLERRTSSVQLPPLSQSASQPASSRRAPAADTTPSPTATRPASHARAQARKPLDSHALSRLPASGH